MLIDGVIELLAADTGVTTLVSDRLYKGVLPRGYTLPAIAAHRYGGTQEYEYAGPIDSSEDQIQLDVYGEDADSCLQVVTAVKAVLNPFVGTLPDGTVVKACYLERDMDMPFLPHADTKGLAFRSLLGYRMVTQSS